MSLENREFSVPESAGAPHTGAKALGRVAAIDFGQARIGLAISDRERRIASPAGVIARRPPPEEAAFFHRFAKENEVSLWVVGLPLHLSGEESPLSQAARAFGVWLEEVTAIPVVFMDERFSTCEAESTLAAAGLKASQRRRKRDTVAAQMILAAFLESPRAKEEVPSKEDRIPD
jgi:putative Holliday junction resolvase